MVRLLLALCLLGCAAPSTQRIGSATATTYPQLDSLLRAGVSTITLRGTIDASGRPPLSVTQDGVTIKGGRIVSGSFYSGGESMNAALIVTASDVTISGVTFVGPTDNPYTQRFTRDSSWCAIRTVTAFGSWAVSSITRISGRYGLGGAVGRWWIVARS